MRGPDHRAWRGWLGFASLLCLMAVLSWRLLDRDGAAEERAVRRDAAQLLALSAQVLSADLQEGHYQEIPNYLNLLGNANPDILSLRVEAGNGTELGQFRRPAQGGPRLHLSRLIPYSYHGLARLSLELDLSGVNARRLHSLWISGGIFSVLAILLAALLHVALRLREETVQLRQRGAELETARQQASTSEERLRQITENIQEVFWITETGPQGRLLYVSPAFETLWQRPLAALYADPGIWRAAIHPDHRSQLPAPVVDDPDSARYDHEYRICRPDGSERWIRERAFPVGDAVGRIVRVAGIAEDITDRKADQARLEFQAEHDQLTGLPNRRRLARALEGLVAAAERGQGTVAVAVLDLDRFKFINDTLGHEAGDAVLSLIAERLGQCLAGGGMVARVGGDEFVVVLGGHAEPGAALDALAQLQARISQPYRLHDAEIPMSCSLGVAFAPQHGRELEVLLRRADAAMYRAKEQGRNTLHAFSAELDRRQTERLQLERKLRDAVQRGEFELAYQAKVDALTHAVVGVEALIRWHHPELGLVPPARFIPIAEETEVILRIGAWALETACAQMQAWHVAGLPQVPISVNLSARQFRDPTLVATIEAVLARTGLPPGFLDLEITESLIMDDSEEALRTLGRLKQLGLQLSVDDFGTGYSNFLYLKRFQPDRLKIDGSFVATLPGDSRDGAIVTGIIGLAHTLAMTVVAEGVETPAQAEFLCNQGCDQLQGYLFSRPVFAEDFAARLRA